MKSCSHQVLSLQQCRAEPSTHPSAVKKLLFKEGQYVQIISHPNNNYLSEDGSHCPSSTMRIGSKGATRSGIPPAQAQAQGQSSKVREQCMTLNREHGDGCQ